MEVFLAVPGRHYSPVRYPIDGSVIALLVMLAACGSGDHAVQDADRPAAPTTVDYSTGTHLVLLGTGTPNADPDAWGPAVAVVAGGQAYIVDAGPGVVRRAAAAARLGVGALEASRLDIAFLTHLHSDHTIGLPDLILSPWVLERERPLRLFGPQGTTAMADHLLQAYSADVRNRIEGLQPSNGTGYRVEAHEIDSSGVIFEDGNVRVTAIPVPHGAWQQSFAYRFDTPTRSIVISGDARPNDAIVEACDGCDILVHEVYSSAGFATRPAEWQRYHADSHTSAEALADIARRARPGLLVLYHQLLWGTSPEELVAEVKRGYEGQVVFGRDLDIY